MYQQAGACLCVPRFFSAAIGDARWLHAPVLSSALNFSLQSFPFCTNSCTYTFRASQVRKKMRKEIVKFSLSSNWSWFCSHAKWDSYSRVPVYLCVCVCLTWQSTIISWLFKAWRMNDEIAAATVEHLWRDRVQAVKSSQFSSMHISDLVPLLLAHAAGG